MKNNPNPKPLDKCEAFVLSTLLPEDQQAPIEIPPLSNYGISPAIQGLIDYMAHEKEKNTRDVVTAVIGSRKIGFFNFDSVEGVGNIKSVVSGGAFGIDTIAKEYFTARGVPVEEIKPDYQRYGAKAAPHVRNRLIIDGCDEVLAIWDGKSAGTAAAVKYAKSKGKKVTVILWQI